MSIFIYFINAFLIKCFCAAHIVNATWIMSGMERMQMKAWICMNVTSMCTGGNRFFNLVELRMHEGLLTSPLCHQSLNFNRETGFDREHQSAQKKRALFRFPDWASNRAERAAARRENATTNGIASFLSAPRSKNATKGDEEGKSFPILRKIQNMTLDQPIGQFHFCIIQILAVLEKHPSHQKLEL